MNSRYSYAVSRTARSSSLNRPVLPMMLRRPERIFACWATMTFSMTVIPLKSLIFWNVRDMPSRVTLSAERRDMSVPEKTIVPLVGLMKPVRQLKRVVLPAPFGPMMLRIVPLLSEKLISSMARMPPKCFETPLASSRCNPSSKKALRPEDHKQDNPCSQREHAVHLYFPEDLGKHNKEDRAHDHTTDAPQPSQDHHAKDEHGFHEGETFRGDEAHLRSKQAACD